MEVFFETTTKNYIKTTHNFRSNLFELSSISFLLVTFFTCIYLCRYVQLHVHRFECMYGCRSNQNPNIPRRTTAKQEQ